MSSTERHEQRGPLYAFVVVAVFCALTVFGAITPGGLLRAPSPIADPATKARPVPVRVVETAVPKDVELPIELTSLPLGSPQAAALLADALERSRAGDDGGSATPGAAGLSVEDAVTVAPGTGREGAERQRPRRDAWTATTPSSARTTAGARRQVGEAAQAQPTTTSPSKGSKRR